MALSSHLFHIFFFSLLFHVSPRLAVRRRSSTKVPPQNHRRRSNRRRRMQRGFCQWKKFRLFLLILLVPCFLPSLSTYANYSNPSYTRSGKSTLKFQLINQRTDFSFALFSGGLSSPKLVAVSNTISFANPKAPVYPRLTLGETWDVMTVTWTSGYDIDEAVFVQWGVPGADKMRSPAGTLTFTRNQMCAAPARTVGWRDPCYIHTSFLKDLWPNTIYSYRMGHILSNGY